MGIYYFFMEVRNRPTTSEVTEMRVAFPYDKDPSHYDPSRITLGPEYIFLENIYSPLVEMDVHGALVSGVASNFEWVDNDAVFTIREDLKTADGITITARDAYLSLKRLLVLSGNTHGNFQDLVCRGTKLNSLNDKCEGLRFEGNKLFVTPERKSPFLFPMLTAIDFAVIPAHSFDHDTLKITNFGSTSGPFYVDQYESGGKITLKANPHHFHYDQRIPQKIFLVPMDRNNPTQSLDALKSGEVDVITTVDTATPESLLQFIDKSQKKYSLHTTHHLRNIVLSFTEKGIAELTPSQRRCIGQNAKLEFRDYFKDSLAFKPEDQFLPIFGEGGLSPEQLSELRSSFTNQNDCPSMKDQIAIPVVRLALLDELHTIFSKFLPEIIFKSGQSPAFIDYSSNPSSMPLFFIAGPDTGFLEDIGLISYSLNSGYFKVDKDQRQNWLNQYAQLDEKADRIALLSKLHFDSLLDPVVVPLMVAPYIAIATPEWDIGLSQLFANCQLWLFKKNL